MPLTPRLFSTLAALALASGIAAHATDISFKIKNNSSDNYSIQIDDYKNSAGTAYVKPQGGGASAELKDSWQGAAYGETTTVSINGRTMTGSFDIKFILKDMKTGKSARFEIATSYKGGWSTTVSAQADGVDFSKELLNGKDGGTITIN